MIQSLWIGKKLSRMEQLSITSFLQNGHSFQLYVYDEVEGVPEHTIVKDANEILPEKNMFKYRDFDSYAGFANMFRYKLLFEKGGYWVDTDVICLKPFQFDSDHMFVHVLEGRPFLNFGSIHAIRPFFRLKRQYYVNTWFIKTPVGSKIMDYCYRESVKRDPKELNWGETGPILLTNAVKKFRMQQYITPYETFLPINEHQWKQLVNNSLAARRKWEMSLGNIHAVHLYNEMWRRNNVDKNADFPVNSIYERLKRLYTI